MNSKKIQILQLNNLRKDFYIRLTEKMNQKTSKSTVLISGKAQIFSPYGNNRLRDSSDAGYEQLLEIANGIIKLHQLIGSDKTRLYADDIFNIALLYDEAGDYENSILLYRESIKILEAISESAGENIEKEGSQASAGYLNVVEDFIKIFYRVGNLAVAYAKTSDFQTASALFIQIKDKLELLDKAESYDYAKNAYNLGNLYYQNGDYGASEDQLKIAAGLMTKVIDIHNCKTSDDRRKIYDLTDVFCSLAYALEALEDYDSAVASLEKSLSIMCKYTDDIEEISKNTFYLANVCIKSKKYEKALEYFNQTMTIIKKRDENKPEYYPRCLNGMAEAYEGLEQFNKSLELRLEAVEQMKRTIGENNFYYANCLKGIGIAYKNIKSYTKAGEYIKHSLEIMKLLLDDNCLEVLNCLVILVDIYSESGDSDSALGLLIETLSIVESDRNDLDEIIARLAKIFVSLGDINDLNEIYNSIINGVVMQN